MNATLNDLTIPLEEAKAKKNLESKRVIGGDKISGFGLLPLKYPWAWDIYSDMRANHWEPEDIPMQKDVEQWRSDEISDVERWIIKMGIGYFSAAEGIVGDNMIHVIHDQVTAPELKLVFRRHAHEENIHADSLVYMVSSLGLNPHECEAIFEGVQTVQEKTNFVVSNSRSLRRDMDMSLVENKQALEMAQIYSDIQSGMMDAFASVISNNLNVVMKQLTLISILLMIPIIPKSIKSTPAQSWA